MKALDALRKAKLNIQFNTKHAGYVQAAKLKRFYLQAITGENIDSLLPQFERSEDEVLWRQRKRLTVENLSPTTAPVLNKFFKVSRLIPRKAIEVTGSEADKKMIAELEANFYNQADVEAYLTSVVDEVAQYDPNAFLLMDYEYDEERDTIDPYPVIFNCEEVYDFHYTRKGVLDYLFVGYTTWIYDEANNQKTKVTDYYMIVKGSLFQFSEITEARKFGDEKALETEWKAPGREKSYRIFQRDSKVATTQITAKRIGYLRYKSMPSICQAPLHPAKPYLQDIIRHKSNYDLSMLLHVFPKLMMFGERCPGEVKVNPAYVCNGGKIGNTNRTCKTCGGYGFKPHKSAQDAQIFKTPTDVKDNGYIPLKDMAFYLSPDLKVVGELRTEIDSLEKRIYVAVFSTDLQRRTNGVAGTAASATEVNIKRDDINDTLQPYANQRSSLFRFIVESMAQFAEIKVRTVHEYPKQLEVETAEEILKKIELLSKGNASETIIDELEILYAKQQFDNDPDSYLRYMVKRRFKPFKGKSETIISSLLAGEYVSRQIKTLYACFDVVFDRLEGDDTGKSFYALPFEKQLEAINKIVDSIVEEAKKEVPAVPTGLPRFGDPNKNPQPQPVA